MRVRKGYFLDPHLVSRASFWHSSTKHAHRPLPCNFQRPQNPAHYASAVSQLCGPLSIVNRTARPLITAFCKRFIFTRFCIWAVLNAEGSSLISGVKPGDCRMYGRSVQATAGHIRSLGRYNGDPSLLPRMSGALLSMSAGEGATTRKLGNVRSRVSIGRDATAPLLLGG